MPRPLSPPLVAIFDSRDDVIEAPRAALEADGFATVTARLAEIQSGTLDLVAFTEAYDPDVMSSSCRHLTGDAPARRAARG